MSKNTLKKIDLDQMVTKVGQAAMRLFFVQSTIHNIFDMYVIWKNKLYTNIISALQPT